MLLWSRSKNPACVGDAIATQARTTQGFFIESKISRQLGLSYTRSIKTEIMPGETNYLRNYQFLQGLCSALVNVRDGSKADMGGARTYIR